MRIRLPRRTVRFRLTALYSGLFLAAGTALLAITYALVDGSTTPELFVSGHTRIAVKNTSSGQLPSPGSAQLRHGTPSGSSVQLARQLYAQAAATHAHDLHQLLAWSGVALGIMAVLAIGSGWVTAGRVLRPLRSMKIATQQITERNLHERLALPGPGDEMKDLADTIDRLLGRLEAAFEAQRRFVASASHELRTPLTLNRALVEVALADPAASAGDLRVTCEDLLAAGEQQERLVEALLTLATTERGLDRTEEFDLAQTTRRALGPYRAQAQHRGLCLEVSLGRAVVCGDPDLAERMAANLIDNAIRYNMPGGSVEVRTRTAWNHAVLTVANTGPPVPADKAGQLLEPFQRLADDRVGHPDGHGLGLSIVASIANAHGARLEVRPHPRGGLTVTTHFPPPPSPHSADEAIRASRSATGWPAR
ncbi:MAG TPA: HAMP domain-containing sensor histidine kinase [Streptosporangiaceae bacterium]